MTRRAQASGAYDEDVFSWTQNQAATNGFGMPARSLRWLRA